MIRLLNIITPTLIKKLAIAGLIIISLTPAVGHIIKASSSDANNIVSTRENRYLAGLPTSTESFTENLDEYVNDNFGLRSIAIKIQRKLEHIMGGGFSDVYIGQDNWLYLGNEPVWTSYQGQKRFTNKTLQNYTSLLTRLKQRCDESGAAFAATIAPNKASIYFEHVPKRFGSPSEFNFLNIAMANPENKRMGLINIKPKLLSQKNKAKLYYKTDTHWTPQGAFLAYQLLMRRIRKKRPDIQIIGPNDLKKKHVKGFKGDLLKYGSFEDVSENFDNFTVLKKDRSETDARKTTGPLKIVLIGDSYSHAYVRFLKPSFDHVIFIHHDHGAFDIDEVFSRKPDAVIFTIVERFSEKVAESAIEK